MLPFLFLQEFWSSVHSLCSEGKQPAKGLSLLASACESLILSVIAPDHHLWLVLQDGLVYKDLLTRKQALFVVKCLIEYISALDDFSTTLYFGRALVQWNKKDQKVLGDIWKPYILLMEILEEKQVCF